MLVREDIVYSYEIEKQYVLMLKRDYERDSGLFINFYMQKRGEAHWIHLFAVPIGVDWTEAVGVRELDWMNSKHITKIVEYYYDKIRDVEIPMYDELLHELEITEERLEQELNGRTD